MSIFAELSDFIGTSVVPRDVEHKGKKRTFHFRELSEDESEKLFSGVKADGVNKGLRKRIIAASVCTETGEPALSVEEAGKLPNTLANSLQAIALEINGFTAQAAEEAKNE